MANREFDALPGHVSTVLRSKAAESETATASGTQAVERDPVDRVVCRAGDSSCAKAHASTLNRSTDSHPERASRSLLQLQRQYGNRYVERVLAMARENLDRQETTAANANDVSPAVEGAIQQERGGGASLDHGVRRQMESSLGADFSGVRVHTDHKADSLNRDLSARAFTTGQDIFFRQGAYQPATSDGRELIAHELTHVVQQGGGVRRAMSVSQPGDPHEVEAEQTARQVMEQEHTGHNEHDDKKDDKKKEHEHLTSMLSRCPCDEAQRQPEALHGKDKEEEEKRRHHHIMTKVDRDATSPQQTNPPQATPTTTPTTVPGGGSSTSSGGTVKSIWEVNWDRMETGSSVTAKSNVRTGKEAASGTMTVMPTGKASDGWSIFHWFNASPSGSPVDVGTVDHPKDTGGTVSSSIAYGLPPSAAADITLDPNVTAGADKDTLKTLQKDLSEKKKTAAATVSAGLQDDLIKFGTKELIEADLNKQVAAAVGPNYNTAVHVTLKPGANAKVPALTAPYDKLTTDGEKRIVNISVPTKTQELKGTRSASTEATDMSKVVTKTEQEKSTKTDVRTDVTTSFLSVITSAYEDMVKKATHDATTIAGGAVGEFGSSLSAGGEIKKLDINLGKLLGLLTIEDPLLALALKTAFGNMEVGGHAEATVGGDLKLNFDAKKEWSDDEVRETLKKHTSEIEQKMTANFKTEIQNQVNEKYSQETTDQHGVIKKGAVSQETVQVNYVVSDQPTLTVTSEVAPKPSGT